MQTNQSDKSRNVVRECIKLDLHLTLKQFFCSLPSTERRWLVAPPCCCKYSSMLQYLWWDKGAHFFRAVYTLVGSKDVYILLPSLVNAYSVLCMLCQNCFWEVQHRLHSEHDKIFFYGLITSCSAVLWNKHEPPWPLWCQKSLTFCTSVPFFHPRTKSVVTSSFLSFHKCLETVILIIFCMLWFIFLCQRLFKGKVSDIVVW